MLFVILVSFLAAAIAPFVVDRVGRHAGWVMAAVPAALLVYFATWIPSVAGGAAARASSEWVPTLGISLDFTIDGLSLLFALLISGLGVAVFVYAGRYLEGHPDLGRFFFALTAFMSAMLGLVLADDLIVMFVFWELTSITSYLLIGFKHEKPSTRDAALQALLVTGGGGLALLAGILLLASITGTTSMSTLIASSTLITEHALYIPTFFLIAIGAFSKSAQVPFHFWLPNAMAAPTPVSAYLHSATMVKAGVYLLARLDPALGGTPVWTWTLCIVGALTMLVGAVAAVRHTDLKKVLAYSTITALGTLVVLIGLSFPAALKAAIVFLIVHSLYKSVLFLVAGSIDHETGTRDILSLGGLRRSMPYSFAAALLAGLSMAGLPPLFGFVGKELAYKAKLGVEGLGWVLPTVAVVANALTVVAAVLLVIIPFFGRPGKRGSAGEAPLALWIGPLVIGGGSLLLGMAPGLLTGLVQPAVDVVAGEAVPITLALWYGINTALLLSIVTVAVGVGAALRVDMLRSLLARFDPWTAVGPRAVFDHLLNGLPRLAAWQTQFFEGGSLRTYLRAVFLTVGALLGGTYLWTVGPALAVPPISVTWIEGAVLGCTAIAAVAVTLTQSRLLAVTALGSVGVGVALLFVFYSAPDLAMTQFLVEILIVVIVLLVLQHLPRESLQTSAGGRARDAAIAVGVGGVVAGLAVAVQGTPLSMHLSSFFGEQAVPGGFGRNVVNVILVDFRALDTLGEIAVIAIAAIGAFVLVKMGEGGPRRLSRNPSPVSVPSMRASVVLQTGTRLLMPLLMIAALFLFWRGHNEPGGGFIGGLVAAAALVLYTVAFRQSGTERVLRVSPRILVATGLLIACASGLLALAHGDPYLTGRWITVELGDTALKLGTPLLFDLGVLLTVIGVVMMMVLALERVSGGGAVRPFQANRRLRPHVPDRATSSPSDATPSVVPSDVPSALER